MRTAMATVCRFCTTIAVVVCAIILASQEVHSQQWVAHAVRIAASKILVNDSTRVVNVSKVKRLHLTEITTIERKRYRLNFSAWVIWRKDVWTGRLFPLSALRLGWTLLQNVKDSLFNTRQLGRAHTDNLANWLSMEQWKMTAVFGKGSRAWVYSGTPADTGRDRKTIATCLEYIEAPAFRRLSVHFRYFGDAYLCCWVRSRANSPLLYADEKG